MKTRYLFVRTRKLFCLRIKTKLKTAVSIIAYQSEGANQRLIQTLHCLSSCFSYEKIVIHTIDTDVMTLLVAYLSDIHRKNLNV